MSKVAVVGQGVVGCSSALALLERFPGIQVTLYGNLDFEKTCSYGPAGLFRLDKYEARPWAKISFDRFAELERNYGPETGIKLISGHIQSDERKNLEHQERNMADIVYNFRWLTDREITSMFPNPSKYAIHYTAYASEGRKYVPWLASQLKKAGANFVRKDFKSLDEVAASEQHDVVINCGGYQAADLAGDDEPLQPVRGVIFEVEAPWHKHFNYRDFNTFTIPMSNSVALGTVKQVGRADMEITDEDRKDIWDRYLTLHPQFKGSKVLSEYIALRPERKTIRLEMQQRETSSGKYTAVHNYGHGGNGFTLAWGCALDLVKMLEPQLSSKAKL